MSSQEKNIHVIMAHRQLSDFLRTLADRLDGIRGETEDAEGIADALENFKKIKISIKDDAGLISLKMKVKSGKDDREAASSASSKDKPRYKKLKKKMKKSFKKMFEAISEGGLPSDKTVASFLRDSELMITYPQYGEEHYSEYEKACGALRNAFQNRNLAEFKAACEEVNRIRLLCHSKYK